MADAPAVSWLKHRYDQLAVTLAVLVLAVSVAFLLVNVQQQRGRLQDDATFTPMVGPTMAAVEMEAFDESAAALERPRQAAVDGKGLLVSETRVTCINPDCAKPIPFDARECPFCGVHQPDAGEIEIGIDTDGDGLPDWWEEKYFGGPTAAVAHEDFDGDGFTNLEEYLAGTDPTDPTSYPPPRIRVARSRASPFNMVFQAASFLDPERPTFQLNMLTSDRTYFAEIGDTVEGYLVERYDANAPEGPTLFLREGPREVPLIRGRIRRHDRWSAVLVTLQDMRTFPVQHGVTFRILADEYKVVDIAESEVVIQNVKSEEEFTVPRLSREELQDLQRRRGGAAEQPPRPAPRVSDDLLSL